MHDRTSPVTELNEHTNGLIQQFLKKREDFGNVLDKKIAEIQNLLSNRPRKVLFVFVFFLYFFQFFDERAENFSLKHIKWRTFFSIPDMQRRPIFDE